MTAGILAQFEEALSGLVYPRLCASCGTAAPGLADEKLCRECERDLERIVAPFCEVCGEGYDSAWDAPFRCANCAGRKLHFEFATAGYRARGRVRELIHRYKYRREFYLCRILAAMLGDALSDPRLEGEEWLMIPVPLHPRRKREREFNQAAELCRQTGRRWEPALRRTRYTLHQAKLDREERLKNLEGAFSLRRSRKIREGVRGANILIVDDVLTTGATTSECARVLKEEGGAARVGVVTVARG